MGILDPIAALAEDGNVPAEAPVPGKLKGCLLGVSFMTRSSKSERETNRKTVRA